jgi:hypothetical protein
MGSRKKDALKDKNHAQDCGTLIGAAAQRPAILPWFSNFGWRPSFRVIRAPCPLCPAAGLLLDFQSAWRRIQFQGLRDHARLRAVTGCTPLRIASIKNLEKSAFFRNYEQKRAPSARACNT